jgi:hypothetical protein
LRRAASEFPHRIHASRRLKSEPRKRELRVRAKRNVNTPRIGPDSALANRKFQR